jgi:starch synthase (maltosyl-transferring)
MTDGARIYNLFPLLAGTIAEWRSHLPRIAAMDFNTIYVNPFHAPGFSGSLYAVKDFYRLNPLFRGGARESDDELLAGFAGAAQKHRLRPMMDLVVNHVAKDNPLVERHPHWFARERDGSVRSPRANDPADPERVTVWGDLAELEFAGGAAEDEVVEYLCGVVRHHASLGFSGFRCDAAYKVPARVWRRLIAAARDVDEKCLFCAETLGAPFEAVEALRGAGFDYLFNSSKWWDFESPWLLKQYDAFRTIAPSIAFPESHDTPRLSDDLAGAGILAPDDVMRRYEQAYAFAACFSAGVMMPMGFEFGWRRRLDVKETRAEPREPQLFDLSRFIRAANAMKRDTPALNEEGPQQLVTERGAPVAAFARMTEGGAERAFFLVNRDEARAHSFDSDLLLEHATPDIELADVTPGASHAVALDLGVPPCGVRVLRGWRVVPEQRASAVPARQPSLHPAWSATARIAIETVYPELDGGRYPVKRIEGDEFSVWADIFRDGHDVIAASLLYRREDEAEWREAPMRFFDNDRWTGRAVLGEVGRWRYTIEAWTDRFASWRADAMKKRDAGDDVALELLEGAALVRRAASRAGRADAALLERLLGECELVGAREQDRILFSRLLLGAMTRADDRADRTRYPRELEVAVDRPRARFGAWYEMIPRSQGTEPGQSATFNHCTARLAEIAGMGFDVVYLPPIHPIGRVNRKGRDNSLQASADDPGSPYAIGAAEGGHTAVHEELGGIDGFRRFLAAARGLGLEVALDFAAQAAPDHPWVKEHPEWFLFRPDGTIKYAENPPKKYQDIVNPEFYNTAREALWTALRDVVLFWIGEGVTIFRVDNPHTKPLPFWEWLIREVQDRHPDTIFLAEAFTRPKMMRALAKAGFTQSYTYFTWRTRKEELTDYLVELTEGPSKEYLRPNFFANTPDILSHYLQQGGRPAFIVRLVLAATLAASYGIYNGFELCEAAAVPGTEEYLHSEKYEYKVWDWDRPGDIKDWIARVNRIRRANPALWRNDTLHFQRASDERVLFYAKMTEDRSNVVLVAVNLDPFEARESELTLPLADMEIAANETFVLEEPLTGAEHRWRGATHRVRLDPRQNPVAIYRLKR